MRSVVALAAALVLSAGFGARAEERGTAGEPQTAEGLFVQGGELFQAGEYQDALESYQRSYELDPVNIVLYNIAMCQRALERHAPAIETFERYLDRGGDQIPSERREEVRALIDEMRRRARDREPPEGQPVDERASGSGAGRTAEPIWPPPRPVEPPPPAVAPAPIDARGRSLRLAAYVTGGVAVAVLGTTLGFYVWNRGRAEDWDETRGWLAQMWMATEQERGGLTLEDLEARYDDNRALGEELQTWSAVEWALLAVGVAALGAAVALLVVGFRARRSPSGSPLAADRGLSFAGAAPSSFTGPDSR